MTSLHLSPAIEDLLKHHLDPHTHLTSPISTLSLDLHPALYRHAVEWDCAKCKPHQRERLEQQRLHRLITLLCQALGTSGLQQGHFVEVTATAPLTPHPHGGRDFAPAHFTLEAFLLLAGTHMGVTAHLTLTLPPQRNVLIENFQHQEGLAEVTGRNPR